VIDRFKALQKSKLKFYFKWKNLAYIHQVWTAHKWTKANAQQNRSEVRT
jgi:hypothetical protein